MSIKNIRTAENVVVAKVEANLSIARVDALVRDLFKKTGVDADIGNITTIHDQISERERPMRVEEAIPLVIGEQSRKNLSFLAPVISEIIKSRKFTGKSDKSRLSKRLSWLKEGNEPRELRKPTEIFFSNELLSTPGDPNDLVLAEILREPDEGRVLLSAVDREVARKSEKLLAEIDSKADKGELMIFDLGIVGDGPNASTATAAVGAFVDTVIISEKTKLAEDWRYTPIFINSSSKFDEFSLAPLPLLNGGTTGIVPRGILGGVLRAADLIGKTALTITYKTKILDVASGLLTRESRTKKYLSGPILGRGVAMNIATRTDNFLMNQRQNYDNVEVRDDGVKVVEITDVRTSKKRKIGLRTNLLLAGAGKEELAIPDPGTQDIYKDSEKYVDRLILKVKAQKENGERVNFEIPKLLTLSTIRKLYKLWETELDRDPKLYPFKDVFKSGVTMAVVGGSGDTGRTMSEFFGGNGPRESYPDDFDPTELPQQTLFNVKEKNRREYRLKNRSRYSKVFTNFVTTVGQKVSRIFRSKLTPEKLIVVSENDDAGYYDYVVVSTGFVREKIEAKLAIAGIVVGPVKDSTGEVVGLGNAKEGILINGPATGFTKEDFPAPIQRVIEALGIKENTVALWVYQILLTRMLWSYFAVKGLNNEKIGQLLNDAMLHTPESVLADTPASLM